MREGVSQDEAKRLLHQHRIEKLLVVDDQYRCVGLITVKDIEKAVANPNACKDEQGRLRVAAATTVGDKGFARTEALIEAGVDLIVVDTAHGHSRRCSKRSSRIKRLSNAVQVVAGNVATGEGAKALIDAGADAIKVGIGPGSICTTRIVAGVGVPQLTAIMDASKRRQEPARPVIADGGIKYSGDLAKALAAGADVRHGRLAARRHRRDAGRGVSLSGPLLQGLSRHGLGRRDGARLGRPLLPAGDQGHAEARAGRRRGAGALQGPGRRPCCISSPAACAPRWAMSARARLDEFHDKAEFVRITGAGLRESHVHDVTDHAREPELSEPGVADVRFPPSCAALRPGAAHLRRHARHDVLAARRRCSAARRRFERHRAARAELADARRCSSPMRSATSSNCRCCSTC